MRIIIDQEKLNRRASLSHAASLGGLLILLSSVAISLWKPELSTLTAVMLFAGFTISVVGIFYANRWVKKPRPENVIDQALKGLSNQYWIYHYLLPCDHVLLTPSGLVVIETCNLEGKFSYRKGKWRQKLTFGRAMRFFVEEKLGNPITRAQFIAQIMKDNLGAQDFYGSNIPVHAVVVFTNPFAEINIENSPIPVCFPAKLSNRLPKRTPKLPENDYLKVREYLNSMARIESPEK